MPRDFAPGCNTIVTPPSRGTRRQRRPKARYRWLVVERAYHGHQKEKSIVRFPCTSPLPSKSRARSCDVKVRCSTDDPIQQTPVRNVCASTASCTGIEYGVWSTSSRPRSARPLRKAREERQCNCSVKATGMHHSLNKCEEWVTAPPARIAAATRAASASCSLVAPALRASLVCSSIQ